MITINRMTKMILASNFTKISSHDSGVSIHNKSFQCINIFESLLARHEVLDVFQGNLVELAGIVRFIPVGVERDEADSDEEEELDGVDDEGPDDGPNDAPGSPGRTHDRNILPSVKITGGGGHVLRLLGLILSPLGPGGPRGGVPGEEPGPGDEDDHHQHGQVGADPKEGGDPRMAVHDVSQTSATISMVASLTWMCLDWISTVRTSPGVWGLVSNWLKNSTCSSCFWPEKPSTRLGA